MPLASAASAKCRLWIASLLLLAQSLLANSNGFPPGHCLVIGQIQRQLPTVVITHGWRYRNSDFDHPPEELFKLGEEIEARLQSQGGEKQQQQANFVYYVWPQASRPLSNGALNFFALMSACRNIGSVGEVEGGILATELQNLLGGNYDQPVHFIAHSFGTVVNAYAIRKLADESHWRSEIQFTMLDSALKWTLLSSKGVRSLLPDKGPLRIGWVDNYLGLPLVAVGTRFRGAGPASFWGGGVQLAVSHCGVIDFYRNTTKNSDARSGFYYSILLRNRGGWNSRLPAKWSQ